MWEIASGVVVPRNYGPAAAVGISSSVLDELNDEGVGEREGDDEAGGGDEEPHRVDVGLAEALQDLVAESYFNIWKAESLSPV